MNANVLVEHLAIPPFEVNCYLVICARTRQAVVIDPAGEPDRILSLVRSADAAVRYLLTTHGHADHVQANPALRSALRIPVCMHVDDDRFFADPEVRRRCEAELGLPPPAPADRLLSDGDEIAVGDLAIRVLHTPGHTPGSVCYLVGGHLFTGDTLFVGAVGRTDLAGGSLDRLLASLADKIIGLPPGTIVWPGHDYGDTPTSTIGREITENPYITDFLSDDDA